MKQIGFKNFRKFENFPTMDLGDITILVGGNNAGKSTLVKALLLTFDNLRSMNLSTKNVFRIAPKFRLDANNIHDIHIGEFGRALYNGAKKSKMEFTLSVDHFTFNITVTGSVDNKVETNVTKIEVIDHFRSAKFVFDYENAKMSVEIKELKSATDDMLVNLNRQLEELSILLKEEKDPEKIANLNAEIKRLRPLRNKLAHQSFFSPQASVTTNLVSYVNVANENVIVNQIRSFAQYIDQVPEVANKRSKEYKVEIENKRALEGKQRLFMDIANELSFILRGKSVEYIYAHAANQNAVYTTDDKNDYLAQTMLDFQNETIKKGDAEDLFIREWMGPKHFGIGYDYQIEGVLGSAFGIRIKTSDKEDDKYVQLADMGMGSIQMMILLFKLATFISKYKNSKTKPTIVLEEPEQNLHPKVQSILTDLFADLNNPNYGFKFIIETHSEYLVRRSEVLVAEQQYKDKQEVEENNPFKVYFFEDNINQPYYEMKYSETGRFETKFGAGFYDAASTTALELSKLEKRRQIQ